MTFSLRASAILSLVVVGCSGPDSSTARAAAEAAEHQVHLGMSIADIVDVAAAQNQPFQILGFCGPKGALRVGGDGGDTGLWAARGSSSGGDDSPEYHFADRQKLRAALPNELLTDGPCSNVNVGFPGSQSWRFLVSLDTNGRISRVESTRLWQ
jgi:hypothetical protein